MPPSATYEWTTRTCERPASVTQVIRSLLRAASFRSYQIGHLWTSPLAARSLGQPTLELARLPALWQHFARGGVKLGRVVRRQHLRCLGPNDPTCQVLSFHHSSPLLLFLFPAYLFLFILFFSLFLFFSFFCSVSLRHCRTGTRQRAWLRTAWHTRTPGPVRPTQAVGNGKDLTTPQCRPRVNQGSHGVADA